MPQVNPFAIAVVFVVLASIIGAWTWAILRLALRQPVFPPNTPRVVPWGGWSVLTVLFATILVQGATSVAYNLATTGHPVKMSLENGSPSPIAMMTVTLLANMATILVVPFVLRLTSGATIEDFGVRFAGLGRQVVRGMVAYPLLAPVVFGTMLLAVAYYGKKPHPLETAIASAMTPGMAVVMALTGVVAAPVVEEFMFRGVLLGWLTRVALGRKARPDPLGEVLPFEIEEGGFSVEPGDAPADFDLPSMNPYEAPRASILVVPELSDPKVDSSRRAGPLLAANVATSLVFAAMHAAVWPTPIPIFFLSLGLGVLYQRTGGILAPIALHMTFNGVSTLLMFLALGGKPASEPPVIDPVPPPAKVQPAKKEAASLRAFGDRSGIVEKKSRDSSILP